MNYLLIIIHVLLTLLTISPLLLLNLNNVTPSKIPLSTLNELRHLGICSVKRTRRGNRGRIRNKSTKQNSVVQPDNKQQTIETFKNSSLKLCLLNARSAKTHVSTNDKAQDIHDLIIDNNLDILALTETWLRDDGSDHIAISKFTPNGYKFAQITRKGKKGGGTAIIYRNSLKSAKLSLTNPNTTYEIIGLKLTSNSQTLNLVTVYRPPKRNTIFFDEFNQLLGALTTVSGKLVICGDFNYHVENAQDKDAAKLLELFDIHNLVQHIKMPTHSGGHTLDLVINRQDDVNLSAVRFDHSVQSDHFAVLFNINISSPKRIRKTITYRKWKEINISDFTSELSEVKTELAGLPASESVQVYHERVRTLVEKHAPEKSCTITVHNNAEWYNDDIRKAKRKRRQLEKQMRKTGLIVHKEMHDSYRNQVTALVEQAKCDHFNNVLKNCSGQKEVFKEANKLLFKHQNKSLPANSSPPDLCAQFSYFFSNKISKIRSSFSSATLPAYCNTHCDTNVLLDCFHETNETEILKIINQSPATSCSLDAMPTWMFKKCLDITVPVTTHIVNTSLADGHVPESLKEAIISPLLKKPSLDHEQLSNYRPVSNLSFISKVLERVVALRLKVHLAEHNHLEPLQSAYRQFHSTETALLKVQSDILEAVDSDGAAILILLDLSAAFDTIDHQLLLDILENRIGITGQALEWFRSYITNRRQCVVIDGHSSDPSDLLYGVPQGSVLGPILFTIYTTSLGNIARSHGLSFHLYADDTQLYLAFKPTVKSSISSTFSVLEICLHDIKQWMTSHYLKLNGDKTEVLIISHKRSIQRPIVPDLHIDNHVIEPSLQVRNLGVIFDSHMTLESHINSVCKKAYFHIRNIGLIRKYIDDKTAASLVQAYVQSRLDYCNSILYGLPLYQIKKLQHVQNSAARVTLKTAKYDHITPILKHLHWLPVTQRIKYKTVLLVFKCLHNIAPEYLSSMISLYQPSRSLRSSHQNLLKTPALKPSHMICRSFPVAGPHLWNQLPLHLRLLTDLNLFKSHLKTHYFSEAYDT